MKEHRSNNSYNSRLTRWVDRLLPFSILTLNLYHLFFPPPAFVAAILAIYKNSAPPNGHTRHINAIITTHSTRATNIQPANHSKLLSALNSSTIHLHKSHSANAVQIHCPNSNKMSSTTASPHTPSANTGQLNFQSTLNSEVNTNRSFNEGPAAPSLGQSKDEVFVNKFTRLFTKILLAVITTKDAY